MLLENRSCLQRTVFLFIFYALQHKAFSVPLLNRLVFTTDNGPRGPLLFT